MTFFLMKNENTKRKAGTAQIYQEVNLLELILLLMLATITNFANSDAFSALIFAHKNQCIR